MSWGSFSFALLKAEAVAIHFEDVDMMGEAVEQGFGMAFGAEDIGLFGDSHCHRAPLTRRPVIYFAPALIPRVISSAYIPVYVESDNL